jgi:hypothetical protein
MNAPVPYLIIRPVFEVPARVATSHSPAFCSSYTGEMESFSKMLIYVHADHNHDTVAIRHRKCIILTYAI